MRINHTGVGGLACQQRTTESVRLDRDVDHVFMLRESLQVVLHGGNQVARALHHDVDRRMAHQGTPVFTNVCGTCAHGIVQRGGAGPFERPADSRQIAARGIRREVGDADQMHTGRARDLSQIHRAELAGANQGHAHRPFVRSALLQL